MLLAPVIHYRNRLYDRGVCVRSLPVPVMSVGNITTGGTGKTPMVIALAQMLTAWGWRVAIISRGYRRKSRGIVVVSDGRGLRASIAESGDEPALIAERVPAAIVVAARQRYAGALRAIERFGAEAIILDDGFQHRTVARQVDVAMVDRASLDPTNVLLPFGTLREPRRSLRRANVLCAVGVEADRVRPFARAGALILRGEVALDGWYSLDGGRSVNPSGSVIGLCGIAHPERFRSTIERAGDVQLAAFLSKRDHYWYTRADVEHVIAAAQRVSARWVLTTEKDAVKLRQYAAEFRSAGCEVGVARISLRLTPPDKQWLEVMLFNFRKRCR